MIPASAVTARAVSAYIEALPPGSFVRAADFPSHSRGAVDVSLHRLIHLRRDFVRAARGLYWKGGTSPYGPGRPSAVDTAIAAAGVEPGMGPATWLAAHAVGTSTQFPSVPELAVVGNPPRRVHGVRYRHRSNLRRIGLRFHEVALLEVLRDWPRFSDGNWDEFAAASRRLIEDRVVEFDRVGWALRGERSRTARANGERLRRCLSAPGPASPP